MDPSTLNAQDELLDAITQLLLSGDHSDIVVACGQTKFRAHKAILSARSPVLARACAKGIWKEECDELLQLGNPSCQDDLDPSDDPVAVEMMLQFIYTSDYLPDQNPYQIQELEIHEEEHRRRSKCSDTHLPLSSTNSHQDHISDAAVERSDGTAEPASSKNAEASGGEEVEIDEDGTARNMHCGLLKLHTRMHALGDKYDMPSLMSLAARKFHSDAEMLEWDDSAFCEAIALAYQAPPEKHNKLNGVIVELLHQHEIISGSSPAIESCIQAFPELAYRLYQRGKKSSQGPACDTCGAVEVRQCTFEDSWNRCSKHFATCRCMPDMHCCCSHATKDPWDDFIPSKKVRKNKVRAAQQIHWSD